MEFKVSIIITFYNQENYVEKCLESCINQSLKDIEIICIDDCSKDGTFRLLKKYESQYKDTIKVYRQEYNSKQGAARNVGIRAAKGKYICFVDGDDYIDITLCEKAYKKAIETSADIVFYDFIIESGGEKKLAKTSKLYTVYSPCSQMVLRSLITSNKLFFPEKTFYEDAAIVPIWCFMSKRKASVNEGLYYYVKHELSTMSNCDPTIYMQILDSIRYREESSKQLGIANTYRQILDYLIYDNILQVIRKMFQLGYREKELELFAKKITVVQGNVLDSKLAEFYFSTNEIKVVDYVLSTNCYRDIEMKQVRQLLDQKHFCKSRVKLLGTFLGLKNNREDIVFWGAGKRGKQIATELLDEGINPVLFDSDVDEVVINDQIKLVVRKLDDLNDGSIVIITSDAAYYDIEQVLLESNKKVDYIRLSELLNYITAIGDGFNNLISLDSDVLRLVPKMSEFKEARDAQNINCCTHV